MAKIKIGDLRASVLENKPRTEQADILLTYLLDKLGALNYEHTNIQQHFFAFRIDSIGSVSSIGSVCPTLCHSFFSNFAIPTHTTLTE